jgi:hypothetical protein
MNKALQYWLSHAGTLTLPLPVLGALATSVSGC